MPTELTTQEQAALDDCLYWYGDCGCETHSAPAGDAGRGDDLDLEDLPV